MSTVLVTGGAGFISEHCILQLIKARSHTCTGHAMRSLGREAEAARR